MKIEAQGKKSATESKIEGNTKVLVGKVKAQTGKLLRNRNLQAEGIAEQYEGVVQKKVAAIIKKKL